MKLKQVTESYARIWRARERLVKALYEAQKLDVMPRPVAEGSAHFMAHISTLDIYIRENTKEAMAQAVRESVRGY